MPLGATWWLSTDVLIRSFLQSETARQQSLERTRPSWDDSSGRLTTEDDPPIVQAVNVAQPRWWQAEQFFRTVMDRRVRIEGGAAVRPEGEGWLFFAGTVLGIAGIMRIFDAIWAFRYHGALPDNLEDAIFGHSLNTYGWVYLVVAAILLVSSFGVLARSQFSRWIGIFAGAVMAISAIWWMPYYPVWSLVYIFLGVLVIYALAVHGGKETAAS